MANLGVKELHSLSCSFERVVSVLLISSVDTLQHRPQHVSAGLSAHCSQPLCNGPFRDLMHEDNEAENVTPDAP